MPRSVRLVDFRDAALDLADELNSDVIPTATVNRWVNQAYGKYYDILIQSGEDYSVKQQLIYTNTPSDPAATSDPATYRLPGDFYKERGFDANLGGNQYTSMHRFNWNDRNLYKLWGTTGWFIGRPLFYAIVDASIIFMPIPQGPFYVTHWYYPVAPLMTQDEHCVDVLSGGDLFVTLYAAGMIAQRQESFELSDRLFAQAEQELVRARDMSTDRDAGEPPRVTETVRRNYGWRKSWGI
jgi:hypothetical protein